MTTTATPNSNDAARVLGRYVLHSEIASGGMATVHFGRLIGPVGFSRTVAIKRMHPHLARDPELVAAFLDEARLAARINHPNVVQTLDVVATDGELFLVMDYVQGESLSRLMKQAHVSAAWPQLRITSAIMIGALAGLHAAHEAKSDRGERLGLVHRDVSPQNILVGADGVPRVLDFGVAKAAGRVQQTREGELKGKLPYMAPEQIRGERVDRRTDVFAAAVVLWEALTGQPLFRSSEPGAASYLVLTKEPEAPSRLMPHLSAQLDAVVLRGLAKERERRFPTALEMAMALEAAVPPATAMETGAWVRHVAGHALAHRARLVAEIESGGATPFASGEPAAEGTEAVTQTEASVATIEASSSLSSAPAPLKTRRTIQVALVAGLAACVALLLWAVVPRSSTSVSRNVAPDLQKEEPASTRAPDLALPSAPPPREAPQPRPVEAAATPKPRRATRIPPRRAELPAPVVSPAAPPLKTVNCENPFVVDSDGTKRPRPECFR
ncbi:MAG: protein kinase [Deltaproteobacteria bacterium]|nr:protein kinase [Deltaproteobacteria bacterium]